MGLACVTWSRFRTEIPQHSQKVHQAVSYALHGALFHCLRVDDLLGFSCGMALCGVPTLRDA